jgi:hypothetical protein
MSQIKSFLFLSWLSQVFYYNNEKVTSNNNEAEGKPKYFTGGIIYSDSNPLVDLLESQGNT